MLTPSQKHGLFKIWRWCYLLLDSVTEALVGYSLVGGWTSYQRSEDDWSAHVVDIVGRSNAPLLVMRVDPTNMILRHNRYGDAREILANDKATLWTITADQAIFTVSDEDIYDTRQGFFDTCHNIHSTHHRIF